VCENRVLRRLFGPRREEMAGGCRKLHNVELQNFYPSPRLIKTNKSRECEILGFHGGEDSSRGILGCDAV
jgi:hypothetical protein